MKTITPVQLGALISDGKLVEMIDVRPPSDFDEIHVVGARSIPLGELRAESLLKTRSVSVGEPLYVICREGILSAVAAKELASGGFSNSIVVAGGMEAWVHEGLPVVERQPAASPWRIPVLVLLIGGIALASWMRDYLVVLPLLIALGVIGLDLIEARRSTTGHRRQALRGRITLARAGGR